MFSDKGLTYQLNDRVVVTKAHSTATIDYDSIAQEQSMNHDFDKIAKEADKVRSNIEKRKKWSESFIKQTSVREEGKESGPDEEPTPKTRSKTLKDKSSKSSIKKVSVEEEFYNTKSDDEEPSTKTRNKSKSKKSFIEKTPV